MIRDRKGQAFVPGFLSAAARTPIITDGELPGGVALFADPVKAAEREQLSLLALTSLLQLSAPGHPCGRCGRGAAAGAAGLCAECDAEADALDAEAALRRTVFL